MFPQIDETTTIGEVAAHIPGAGDVFKRHHIDFCCGGDRKLLTVLRDMAVSESTFLQDLEKASAEAEANETFTNWSKRSCSELVDWVVDRHHGYLNQVFPDIGEKLMKLVRVHGDHHPELMDIMKTFLSLRTEMESHMIDEEMTVFPRIVYIERNPEAGTPESDADWVAQLEHEHESAGQLLKKLRTLTDDFTTPPDGCRTYHYTFDKLAEMEADVFQHIHLENNILFPRVLNMIEN